MIVIVGHGPSILSGLGSVIDSFPVVRLKTGIRNHKVPSAEEPAVKDPIHFGTRTDFICARSNIYDLGGAEFWHFNDPQNWVTHYRKYSRKKPSTGLCAVFCAIDRGYEEIGLIGFDRLLNPNDMMSHKWFMHRTYRLWPGHDQVAENKCLFELGVKIVNLPEMYGKATRLGPAEGSSAA